MGRVKLLALGSIVPASLALAWMVSGPPTTEPPALGSPFPPLQITSAHGQPLSSEGGSGSTLMSFIEALPEDSPAYEESRRQLVFLQSVKRQHRDLRLLVVQAGSVSQKERLANFAYDHGLELGLGGSAFAARRGVKRIPTTFLISPEGTVQARWEGFVSAATLAESLGTFKKFKADAKHVQP